MNIIMSFEKDLEEARDLADIFEVVKSAVLRKTGQSRGGLMLGLADLGNHPHSFLGGFFSTGSNVIVMNRNPLDRVAETKPDLYRAYAFHVLLHEYIHSLGCLDEEQARARALKISKEALGDDHPATLLAADVNGFMKYLVYPDYAWKPDDERMELVKGFDRSSVSYIA